MDADDDSTMKTLTLLLSCLFAVVGFSAEVNITNIPTSTAVAGTDYVLGQTNGANGATRRIQWNTPLKSGLSPLFSVLSVTNGGTIGGGLTFTGAAPAQLTGSNADNSVRLFVIGTNTVFDTNVTFYGMVTNLGGFIVHTNGSMMKATNGTMQLSNNLSSVAAMISGSNMFQIDTLDLKKSFQVTSNGAAFFGTNVTITGGQITGNGGGITNAWIKTTLFGSMIAAIPTSSRFVMLQGNQSATQGAAGNAANIMPIGGYLTNLQIWGQVSWPSTTNIVITLQTNVGLTAPVNSALTLTYAPAVGGVYTNSGTTSLVLPDAQNASGYVGVLNFVTTSSGGNIAQQQTAWSVDWYHRSP